MKEKIVVCTGRRLNQNRFLTTLSSVPMRRKNCKYKHKDVFQLGVEREAHRISDCVTIITGTLSIIKAKQLAFLPA